jgi:hypothetical protein
MSVMIDGTDGIDGIDVIEAFADGEPVAPAQLKAALADEAARDHLIDILVLRGMVGGQTMARPAAFAAPVVARPAASAPPARLSWARWLPAAAAVALIGGITGYLAGSRAPAAAVPDSSAMAVSSAPAPAPTQVIHLREGVDWTEKAGGN